MIERQRLFEEKWIEQKINDIEIVLNYCRVITHYPKGIRAQTYKLDNGKVSKNYLVINHICYNYSSTPPVVLPPGLEWKIFINLSNERFVQVITKNLESEQNLRN